MTQLLIFHLTCTVLSFEFLSNYIQWQKIRLEENGPSYYLQ